MQTTTPMTIGRPVNGAAIAAQAAADAANGSPDTQPNSPHNHMQWHGLAGYNGTGITAGTGSLNFTTTWTPNSAGQTPDLDTHVLLAPGYGPYTVSGGQSPFGVNTATRPWPYGSAEFERNVYYVQPTITFAGATATFSGDVDGSTTLTGNCARSGGACEEVRITGTVPGGEYRQDTYRPLARPLSPANPSGTGSTYQTTVWATPGVVIDSVTVNGVRQFANQLGDFRTAAMSGSLLTDTGRSPEVVVNVRNVSPHAEGALSGSQWVRGQLSSLARPIERHQAGQSLAVRHSAHQAAHLLATMVATNTSEHATKGSSPHAYPPNAVLEILARNETIGAPTGREFAIPMEVDFQSEAIALTGLASTNRLLAGISVVYLSWPETTFPAPYLPFMGAWDYKNRFPLEEKVGQKTKRIYEDAGNFTYGFHMAAAGVPMEIAQRGAGLFQRQDIRESWPDRVRAALGAFPFGDDADDQRFIIMGYEYYRSGNWNQ
jgi:hypothetical protein